MKNSVWSFCLLIATSICFAQDGKPFTEKDATGSLVPNLYVTTNPKNACYDIISNFELDEDAIANYNTAIKEIKEKKPCQL